MYDVALTASQRSNVYVLRENAKFTARTSERLSTGRKVNNVADNPIAYFQSKDRYDRSSLMLERKENIDQALSSLEAAINGLDTISDLVKQMKGLVEAAKSQSQTERRANTDQFNEIAEQISYVVRDASYNGLRLLDSTSNELDISFSDKTQSRHIFEGVDLTRTQEGIGSQLFSSIAYNDDDDFLGMSALVAELEGGFTAIGNENSQLEAADQLLSVMDKALGNLRAIASSTATSVDLLSQRSDFSAIYSDILIEGGDKLTLADMNEEGATMTLLQTQQQLAIQALAIAGEQQQAVVGLLQ